MFADVTLRGALSQQQRLKELQARVPPLGQRWWRSSSAAPTSSLACSSRSSTEQRGEEQ